MINDFVATSSVFGVVLTIFVFQIGILVNMKYNKSFTNPLLIGFILCSIILIVFKIDYDSYNASAQYVTYLLAPTTVCLAITMYEQINALKSNWKAVFAGVATGIFANFVMIYALCKVFGLDTTQFATLLPKSTTTAIAIPTTQIIGGIVPITVAAIVFTGILGNVFGEQILKFFKVEEPVAKGLALGSASHSVGIARALQIGPVEGSMATLAMVTGGLGTAIVASFLVSLY